MFESLYILNRKSLTSIKSILFSLTIFLVITLILIYNIKISFFYTSSCIVKKYNSKYFLELNIPVKYLEYINENNQIIIDNKEYNYEIFHISEKITTTNNVKYLNIYLDSNLLEKYKKDNYISEYKILIKHAPIIDYLKMKLKERKGIK